MTRDEAFTAEYAALEALKRAAVDHVASKSGGYSTTRIGRDDGPLMARSRLIRAAEAWVVAAHATLDAIMDETREERRQHERPTRDHPVRVRRQDPPDRCE